MLSVAAVQDSATVVPDTAAVNPAGTVGAWESAGAATTACTAVDAALALPAASTAMTL